MEGSDENGAGGYTCMDYRAEMILAGLEKRLAGEELDDRTRAVLEGEVRRLEREMGLD
ncbi:MAG: hypothetical protein ACLFOY_16975 [Desulfatibacillaceae bacterium]